jgi:hypothetical protein
MRRAADAVGRGGAAPSASICAAVCAFAAFFAPAAAHAQGPRDHAIPSCYEQLREYAPRGSLGSLTVIIDQTTYLDARLRQIVRETVGRLVKPGTSVSIAVFSAYLQGRYLDVLVSGQVESPIAPKQRDFVPKRQLLQTDQCLEQQLLFARRLMEKTIDSAFAASDPNLAKSDILAALHDVSRHVAASSGDGRIVIVVSDMLENSSITSFYQAGRLRLIDPEGELRRVASAGIAADFYGAKVFVIGAGAAPGKSSDERSYRDPRGMLALESFWRRWFAAGKGELVEFGKPTPLREITWHVPGLAANGDAR